MIVFNCIKRIAYRVSRLSEFLCNLVWSRISTFGRFAIEYPFTTLLWSRRYAHQSAIGLSRCTLYICTFISDKYLYHGCILAQTIPFLSPSSSSFTSQNGGRMTQWDKEKTSAEHRFGLKLAFRWNWLISEARPSIEARYTPKQRDASAESLFLSLSLSLSSACLLARWRESNDDFDPTGFSRERRVPLSGDIHTSTRFPPPPPPVTQDSGKTTRTLARSVHPRCHPVIKA